MREFKEADDVFPPRNSIDMTFRVFKADFFKINTREKTLFFSYKFFIFVGIKISKSVVICIHWRI